MLNGIVRKLVRNVSHDRHFVFAEIEGGSGSRRVYRRAGSLKNLAQEILISNFDFNRTRYVLGVLKYALVVDMAILDALEMPCEPLTHPKPPQLVYVDIDLFDLSSHALALVLFELARVVKHLDHVLHTLETRKGGAGDELVSLD